MHIYLRHDYHTHSYRGSKKVTILNIFEARKPYFIMYVKSLMIKKPNNLYIFRNKNTKEPKEGRYRLINSSIPEGGYFYLVTVNVIYEYLL